MSSPASCLDDRVCCFGRSRQVLEDETVTTTQHTLSAPIKPLRGLTLTPLQGAVSLLPAAQAIHRRATILGADVAAFSPERSGSEMGIRVQAESGHMVELGLHAWYGGKFPCSDTLLQSASGLTAWHRRATGALLPLGIDYVSALTASLAMTAAVAGLLGQQRGLTTRKVRVNLSDAALLSMSQYLAMELAGQVVQAPQRSDDCTPPFRSRDAVVFELEALDAEAWQRFWYAAGASAVAIEAGWSPFMLRYTQACAFLPAALFETAAQHDYAALQVMAQQAGVGVCALRQANTLDTDSDIRAWIEHGPWRFGAMTTAQQTFQTRISPSSGSIQPLSGITVLESCRLIQGPLAGHLLRLLGARVIKIEPPGGDPMRGMPPLAGEISAHFDAINHGKEPIELDLRSATGRTRLLELAKSADVFVHNWAPGRAERLGLTALDFRKCAPNIIYASASGTGRIPAKNAPVATDFMMQAFSGLASLIRQPQGQGGALLTLVDVLGGAATAEGIVAALYARANGKGVGELDSAMAGAAVLLVADELERARNRRSNPGRLNAVLNLPAAFRVRDGYLMLEALPDAGAEQALLSFCGLTDCAGHDVVAAISAAFAEYDAAHWCNRLMAGGMAAAPIALDSKAVMSHPWMQGTLKFEAGRLRVPCPCPCPWTFTS